MGLSPVILEGSGLEVFGLPAHPLVVHAAVVLVPLAAIAFILSAWRKQWREVYLLPITLLAMAGAGAAFLAKETGESLEETVKETGKRLGEHPEQGDTSMVVAIIFGACVTATYILYRFDPQLRRFLHLEQKFRLPVSDELAAYVVTTPVAIAAVILVVVAGHSGAALVWK